MQAVNCVATARSDLSRFAPIASVVDKAEPQLEFAQRRAHSFVRLYFNSKESR